LPNGAMYITNLQYTQTSYHSSLYHFAPLEQSF